MPRVDHQKHPLISSRFAMTVRLTFPIFIMTLLFLLQGPVLSAYEPTFNEMLNQRRQLETFCKLKDNQRRFDICEKYKAIKGKLPDRSEDIIIFRQLYEKNGKQTPHP